MSEHSGHDFTACAQAWQTLRRAHARVAERLDADLDRACALAINEFDVLLYLRAHQGEETRISALLETVALSQPALSRLVARLEGRGLLARSATEADGRATAVCLTERGTALIDHAIEIHARAVNESLISRFSDEEQRVLLELLAQIGR